MEKIKLSQKTQDYFWGFMVAIAAVVFVLTISFFTI